MRKSVLPYLFWRRLGGAIRAIFVAGVVVLSGCGEPAGTTGPETTPDRTVAATDRSRLEPVGIWQDEDPYLRGYPVLAEAVAALGTNMRVLHTGAHPDDEMSDLVAYLARGRHFRTAYLAANRGEGGQNGIGPEQGADIGVLRTEELLAARRIDGAEQYFLSKPDFGFSKTAAETLKIWGEAATLKELVHFIRWYRPHVMVSAFSGTPFDGHGHHQAMGILTRKAFDAAADAAFEDDLPPWKTQILYQSLWRDPGEDKLPGKRFLIDVGEYNALHGKTYHQIAMEGRSQHRSQDMGAAQDPGPKTVTLRLWAHRLTYFAPLEGVPFPLERTQDDPFQPFYLLIWPVHELLGFPTLEMQMRDKMFADITTARQAFQSGDRQGLLEGLYGAAAAARTGKRTVEAIIARLRKDGLHSDNVHPNFNDLLIEQHEFSETARQCERALWQATGVAFEVRCDQRYLTPGQPGTLTVRVIPQVQTIGPPTVAFDHAAEWQMVQTAWTGPDEPVRKDRSLPTCWTFTYSFTVPADAAYTQPVYQPMAWAEASAFGNHHQATMDLPPIVAHLTCTVGAPGGAQAAVKVSTSAQYVWVDPRFGERREMVKVAPPVSVAVEPAFRVRLPSFNRELVHAKVGVTALTDRHIDGRVSRLIGSDGKTHATEGRPLQFRRAGETATVELNGIAPEAFAPPASTATVAVGTWPAVGAEFAMGIAAVESAQTLTRIDYPHIRPHNIFRPAQVRLLRLNVTLPENLQVGFLSGTGTGAELVDALTQMGATVTVLDAAALNAADLDLSRFDTILAGVRAYEVRADLVAQNPRLLDYVKAGGTLVVLYEKYPFAKLGCAPAPFQYSQPHDRVTEEDAPVKILQPEHKLLNWPNKITADDFKGWFQDRGLYFFAEAGRDSGYVALLSCHDAGEPAKTGGLLDYSLGKGHWVYCAYALHLQIPQAVPGAWRLLANLAAYGRERQLVKAD